MLHLKALQYRWLVKLLTTTQLLYNTCLLELSLELLESLLNVLAFFYWYNNHLFYFKLFMLNLILPGPVPRKAGAKLLLFYKSTKFLHIFYQIIRKILDFHVLTMLKTCFNSTKCLHLLI